MDEKAYSKLQDVLRAVPDVPKPQGKRHGWSLLVTLNAGAMSSGTSTGKAIARKLDGSPTEGIGGLTSARTWTAEGVDAAACILFCFLDRT